MRGAKGTFKQHIYEHQLQPFALGAAAVVEGRRLNLQRFGDLV
jgi:hypothetical protein